MAMSMSGEVKARERRTATAERVCQRRTATITPSVARALGCEVKAMERKQSEVSECVKVSDGVARHPLDEHRACVTSGSG